MIALLLAVALHVTTPPEIFFCDDLHGESLQQCVSNARKFFCGPLANDDGDMSDFDAAVVMAERQVLCMRTHVARRYGRRAWRYRTLR